VTRLPGGAPERSGISAQPLLVLRQMAAAAMLGAAVFLVEAGAAEIILRGDRICQEIRAENWAFAARGCQPEIVRWFLQGLSRGVVGALAPGASPFLGVMTMAIAFGLVASLLGRLPLKQAIPAYFAVQILLAGLFGLLAFFVSYVR
jgi:hypothetical protein